MPLNLAEAIFWIAVACCAIAQAAILRSVIISPTQADHATPTAPSSVTQSAAHRAIEIGWAVLPGVGLIFLFLYTWTAIHSGTPAIPPS